MVCRARANGRGRAWAELRGAGANAMNNMQTSDRVETRYDATRVLRTSLPITIDATSWELVNEQRNANQ
eukprot:11174792-Lingulodinium_polyedra.AAC.1